MSEKLTKYEWEKKILAYHIEVLKDSLNQNETHIWWSSDIGDNKSLRLSMQGLQRFEETGLEFHSYEGDVACLTSAILLGLCRMPIPFYLATTNSHPVHFKLSMADEEYAMLFMFMNNDLDTFAKGFLRK